MSKQNTVLGFQRHPASAHWPGLDEEEFEALVHAIQMDGQREAIVVTKAKRVVDGWHRLLACDALNLNPVTETRNMTDPEAAKFAIRMHQSRRHLTKEQLARATLDTQLACGMTLAKPGDRRNPSVTQGGGAPDGRVTAASLAKAAGVSTSTARNTIQKKKREQGELPPKEQSAKDSHPAADPEPTKGDGGPDPLFAMLDSQLQQAASENESLRSDLEAKQAEVDDLLAAASPEQKNAIKKLQDQAALVRTLKSQLNEWQAKHRDAQREKTT